uniref:Reverse transcriptase zinc-binding domain-containing protein n=1 Tax=Arundo donax TaxID=35708 RepID=A0A0A9DUI9_ARUDO
MDRLNTRNILRRKIFNIQDNNYNCILCNSNMEETTFHLFFSCQFSVRVWNYLDIHWDHGLDFFSMMQQAKADRQLSFFMEVFIVAAWHIWKQKNSWIFESRQPNFEAWKEGFHEEMSLQTYRFRQILKVAVTSWLQNLA